VLTSSAFCRQRRNLGENAATYIRDTGLAIKSRDEGPLALVAEEVGSGGVICQAVGDEAGESGKGVTTRQVEALKAERGVKDQRRAEGVALGATVVLYWE